MPIALTKALKLSGAESLSVAGNIFLGQTESPLMIKTYLEKIIPDHSYWENRGISKDTLDLFNGGVVKGGVMADRYTFPIFNSKIISFYKQGLLVDLRSILIF